jgi:NAD(P)-dependent dehydrogenase (short-subunit alcohol dehydrogenase family)
MSMPDVLAYYQDREVLVTGCSSGIGGATAQKLQAAGAKVIGVDIKPPPEPLAEFIETDLGNYDSIRAAVARLAAPIWGVFNCAGLSGGGGDPVTVLRINFLGLRELNEAVVPLIPNGGAIVSVASGAGQDYAVNAANNIGLVRTKTFQEAEAWVAEHESYVRERGGYPVSKESLVLYTLDRCIDLAASGVRINVIGPGVTDTPMLQDSAKIYGMEHLMNMFKPLGRVATAEEQANILIYLNSDSASYINGQPIWSDGGVISRRIVADVLEGDH